MSGIDKKISPNNQTDEEWWADYDSYVQKHPDNHPPVPINENRKYKEQQNISPKISHEILFRYVDHRTTKNSSLVLTFVSLDEKIKVIKFFNVSLEGRNQKYPAKNHGQFNPPERGKFREFWLLTVGFPPPRWCRIHKTMRSTLKGLTFTGNYDTAYDSKGNPYNKFSEVNLYERSTI